MRPGVILFSAGLALMAGCAVGPDYRKPEALKSGAVPGSFGDQESATNAPQWKAAEPSAQLPRGSWWKIFTDSELDRLESLAETNNQDLAASAARFEQARALVGVARADYFPQLSAEPSLVRQRTSANAPQLGVPAGKPFTYNTYTIPLDLSWELDLWGRVRRQTESARAKLSAAAEDLQSVRLALQAEVAVDYFSLRALDAEASLVADTVETYRRSLELTQNRRKGGIASDLDVSEAETQLRATEAELPAIKLQVANNLHALATLCGLPATGFEVADASSITNAVPSLPGGLPSRLLERRPDISAAERRMAAANADVGVARTAFYPEVVINGMAGFESLNAATLFDWPSRVWAIGPTLNLPLFTGGRNRAQLAEAHAAYDETVAAYRQIVLVAFEEVEDQLAAQRLLAEELQAETAAFTAASHTLDIANNRYKSGLVTYLEVATSQSAALANERSVVQLRGERLVAEVSLIKALGGGWESDTNRVSR